MLQTRTVEPATLELLKQLMLLPVLESFFLVGGTAIALQLGHRKSIDLDLFTAGPFNNSTLLEALAFKYEISVELEEPNMLITTIEGIKVDFVKLGYPILFPSLLIEGVRMLDLRDIAAMKLKAIAYAHTRWSGLGAYVLHGQMEIDNNLVENAVRPLAVGRKAYLFAGSHQAAEMTAAMYSFMASCKKNNINEFDWLKDVFERIQSHKQKELYQLLPSNWEEYRPK